MIKSKIQKTKGTIFKWERFALHDGPGIRTVMFLKGCPLKCAWCSSPESQKMRPEMVFFAEKCRTCKSCVSVCPTKANTVLNGEIVTDRRLCDDCGECVAVCPSGARALIGREITVQEAMDYIDRDAIFYHNSNGGVTLSGGEPTMQPDFAIGVLKGCQHLGIHTAMETCGYAQWDVLEAILEHLDLVYVDVKHAASARHEEVCGLGNELIRGNLRRVAHRGGNPSLVVRIPVIPDVNDSVENIADTARFVQELGKADRIELLPYHRFGTFMYPALDREYELPDMGVPSGEHLARLQGIVESFGVTCVIGG